MNDATETRIQGTRDGDICARMEVGDTVAPECPQGERLEQEDSNFHFQMCGEDLISADNYGRSQKQFREGVLRFGGCIEFGCILLIILGLYNRKHLFRRLDR